MSDITLLSKNNFQNLDISKWQSYTQKNPRYRDLVTLKAYEPRPDNYKQFEIDCAECGIHLDFAE